METGGTPDSAGDAGEHEGEVDPDVAAQAAHLIMDRARQDSTFAMEIQLAAASRGYNDLVAWANANPLQVILLAEGLTDIEGEEAVWQRVVTKTHDVMRELSSADGDA